MTIAEIKPKEVNPELVEALENMLDDAKDGKLQGIIGTVIFDDGISSEFWVSPPKHYQVNVVSDRIIGCLERLKYQLLSMRYNVDAEDSWTSS